MMICWLAWHQRLSGLEFKMPWAMLELIVYHHLSINNLEVFSIIDQGPHLQEEIP